MSNDEQEEISFDKESGGELVEIFGIVVLAICLLCIVFGFGYFIYNCACSA